MTYEIEKNVPIPAKQGGGTGLSKKLRELDVGDSIFIPDKKISGMSGHIASVRAGNTKQFACRSMDGGVRIWRTE